MTTPHPESRRAHLRSILTRFKPFGLVGLLYFLAVVAMTWPAASDLSGRLIGNNVDNWIFYWNNWWFRFAVSNQASLWSTSHFFFPIGTDLVFHSNSFVNSFLAYLLDPFAGPVAAYNITLLVGLWLSAVGMFLLARQVTGSRPAAFIAGLIYAFAPYHLTQVLAHMHLGSIQWWPFFIWMFSRLPEPGGWRRPVLGGAFFAALTVWTGLHLAILLGFWAVAYLAWVLLVERRRLRQQGAPLLPPGQIAARLAALGALTILLTLPFWLAVLTNWSDVGPAASSFDESSYNQTDLAAYAIPPTYHPIVGDIVQPIYERFLVNRAYMPYIGIVAGVLAVIGIFTRRRAAEFWLFSGFIWLILALGPALRFNGQVFSAIPLPYRFISEVLPIGILRSSDRFNLLLLLSIVMLAALGAASVTARRRFLVVPISLLVLLEFAPVPLPRWELLPHSEILSRPGNLAPGAVIDYPMGYARSKFWIYYQTLHEQPIIEGHVSRHTKELYSFISRQPLLSALYDLDDKPSLVPDGFFASIPTGDLGPSLRDLVENGVRWLVVHRSFADSHDMERLHMLMPITPVNRDEAVEVYDLARPLPWRFGRSAIGRYNGIDWVSADPEIIDSDTVRVEFLAQWAGEGANIGCSVSVGESAAELTLFPNRSAWLAGDLYQAGVEIALPPDLAPGPHDIVLSCDSGEAVRLDRQLVVTDSGERLIVIPGSGGDFAEGLSLAGANWRARGSSLDVALHWQATADVGEFYKFFVSLLDENGQVVRHFDSAPCNWTCPTGDWQAGDRHNDLATLDLWGVPPGSYRLVVGFYDEASGRRLEADQNGILSDSLTILDDFTVTTDEQSP